MAGPARDAGYVDYSSSSASGFIPEIWSGKLVEKFYDATVFGAIANTDYEGEIKNQGDTVNIRTRASITIRDYVIGGGLTYENPTSPMIQLNIDKAKYFAFECNDIDKHQSDLKLMDDWSSDAGEQMKIAIDRDVLGAVYADVDADNAGAAAGRISGDIDLGEVGAPVGIDKDNILDFLVDLGSVLDEQNVPESGRWVVLPAWACGTIKKSDLKDASLAGDSTSIMRNGRVGMIDRFEIFMSNNVSTVTDGAARATNIIAGHKAALTFAAQMTQMEELPNQSDFGRLVRGLNVFGYKVVNGKAMVHGYVTKK